MMLKQAVRVRQIIGQRDLILWFRLGNVPFLYKKLKKNRSLLSSQHPTAAFGHFELIESVINKQ